MVNRLRSHEIGTDQFVCPRPAHNLGGLSPRDSQISDFPSDLHPPPPWSYVQTSSLAGTPDRKSCWRIEPCRLSWPAVLFGPDRFGLWPASSFPDRSTLLLHTPISRGESGHSMIITYTTLSILGNVIYTYLQSVYLKLSDSAVGKQRSRFESQARGTC